MKSLYDFTVKDADLNDFSLEDINPLSDTYEQLIGPSYLLKIWLSLVFFMNTEVLADLGSGFLMIFI